jgi:hypothetical protein
MAVLTQRVGHSYDTPNWSVATLVKNPSMLPNMVIRAVKDNLIAEQLLRKGPNAPGGAVQYQEQVVFSSLRDAEIIAEFGEIPTTQAEVGLPIVAATQKRGLGLKVSREMETRNDTGRVAEEIRLTKEALIRNWNKIFYQAVYRNPNILTMTASNAANGGWLTDVVPAAGLTPTAGIRKDIAQAKFLMSNQVVQGAVDNDRYGHIPDTMILHPSVAPEWLDSDEVNKVYEHSPATTMSPRFQMKMDNQFAGLDIVLSWEILPDHAMICKRKTMGFISDEWPLGGSPTQYTEREQTYATYFTRRSLVAIDNPKSIVLINGIDGNPTAAVP